MGIRSDERLSTCHGFALAKTPRHGSVFIRRRVMVSQIDIIKVNT